MLGDNLIYVFLIGLVGILALTVNYLIANRESQNEHRSERLTWLKEQAEHTLNALAVLKEVGCRKDIVEKLNQHAMTLIEEIDAIAPNSDLLADLNREKDSADRMKKREGGLDSDRAVRRAQIYLNYAERLLIELAKKGRITPQLAHIYQQELYWLNVTMVSDAHLNQATRLLGVNEKQAALSHFKHAKAILVRATVPMSQKNDKIKAIQQQIDEIRPRQDYTEGTLADSIDKFLNR